jgi:hypothetical protein
LSNGNAAVVLVVARALRERRRTSRESARFAVESTFFAMHRNAPRRPRPPPTANDL